MSYRAGMSDSRLPRPPVWPPMSADAPPARIWPAPSTPGPWPLHGVPGSREVERRAQGQVAPFTLMRRAGTAVARLALALAPHASRLWIVCGPGNNGGDGLVAAAWLHRAGRAVHVSLLAQPSRLPADARSAFDEARAAGVAMHPGAACPFAPSQDDLAIDALLGLGSARAPEGALKDAVLALRAWPGPVLAVDLPTGLDGETGRLHDVQGGACVRADHTLSLLTLKPGLFTGHGRDYAGTVWWHDLGTAPEVAPDAWLASPQAVAATAVPRRHAEHKGSFGDVIVLGGAPGMVGAAVLAARAALRAGAGRVHLLPLAEHALAVDIDHPELMVRELSALEALLRGAGSTVVCGCGGGEAVAHVLPTVLHGAARLVLDADALNALALDANLQTLLAHRGERTAATLLTPHPLEAARLLGRTSANVQADRLGAARSLSQRFGCTVLLKGSGTVIATPEGATWINPTGNAALATAGTGDVLSGWLGGTWRADEPALDAAVRAAWGHGAAADRWRASHEGPLPASQLITSI